MNKKITTIIVALIVLAVVAVSGCIGGDDAPKTATFSGNGVSFEYPAGWTKLSNEEIEQYMGSTEGFKVHAFVGENTTGEDGFAVFSINSSMGLKAKDMSEIMSSSSSGYKFLSNKTTTVDGTTAYIVTVDMSQDTSSTGENYLTYVFFDKNNELYMLIYVFADKADETKLDPILETFKVTG